MITGLNNAAKEIHEAAVKKGFYDKRRELGTTLMLCVTEIAEALDADQKGMWADLQTYEECEKADDIFEKDKAVYMISSFKELIKDTVEDEIADTMIRLLDFCGDHKIDIERHIELKLQYNATRPYKHGKKY